MRNYGCFGDARALGALSILTSFLYLSDACVNVLTIHKQQSSWKVDFLYISYHVLSFKLFDISCNIYSFAFPIMYTIYFRNTSLRIYCRYLAINAYNLLLMLNNAY